MKFLSTKIALYLYKPTMQPCMEYCCHAWASAPSCYLEMLNRIQKWICRAFGPSLAASHESLTFPQLKSFYWYHYGRCSAELAQLVTHPYSCRRSNCYSDRLHDYSVTTDRFGKDVYGNSFFPHITRLWNSMPIECFFSTATWLSHSQSLAILARGQPHSPNANHCVSTILTQRSPTNS